MKVGRGDPVLDIGVGRESQSLAKLRDMEALVTAIDIDINALRKHKILGAHLVQCNAGRLPFRNAAFNFAIANYTFHEIDPPFHANAFTELLRVARRVMVVEPAPGRDPVCRRFQEIWTQAMHSIGHHEDYARLGHWAGLMQKSGAQLLLTKAFVFTERLIGQEGGEYVESSIREMTESGVAPVHIDAMKNLKVDVETKGMIFPDANVIIGGA